MLTRFVTKINSRVIKLNKKGIVLFELLLTKKKFVIFICVRFLEKIPDWLVLSKNDNHKMKIGKGND